MVTATDLGSRTIRVLGIHLAGSQSPRSALVRANFVIGPSDQSSSDSPTTRAQGPALGALRQLQQKLFECSVAGQRVGPLIVDSFIHGLGPERDRDADSRLLEAVADMGSVDCYVFDSPLGTPPCTECPLVCPGSSQCQVDEVRNMFSLWQVLRKKGLRLRSPQPYMDRYWDYFCRYVLEGSASSLHAEFEAMMGSNRAPVAARARYLARAIMGQSGKDRLRVLETQSTVSACSWYLESQHKPSRSVSPLGALAGLRAERSGRALRRAIMGHLLESGRLVWGAHLDQSLIHVARSQTEVVLATVAALTARCLATGEVFLQDDFLSPGFQGEGQPWLPAAAGLWIGREHV
jgi:hypothetical protein